MPRKKPVLRGNGVAALRESLIEISSLSRWPLLEPLPVTRYLGESFGISNVSSFRVLNELSDSGHLWRATNGRYFLPGARRLLEKPAPLACLFRRLEQWTIVGREIMLGVDEACGNHERAMLLVHDRVLFRQTDALSPATIGSESELRTALEDFLLVHSERVEGMVLDELWPDSVLAAFKDRLSASVVVYRQTKLSFLGSVSADAHSAAGLVIDHARKNEFERLCVIMPGHAYQPSDEMEAALQTAAVGHFPKPKVFRMRSPLDARRLVAALRKQGRKILLVATEDNTAVAVLDVLLAEGIEVPRQVGLITTMGSRIAGNRFISAAGFDFRRMGQEAAMMAISGELRHASIPPALVQGTTT